jgi:hypothetical protein
MMIFHSYVSLPEVKFNNSHWAYPISIHFPFQARIGCGGMASGRCVFWWIFGRWLGSH